MSSPTRTRRSPATTGRFGRTTTTSRRRTTPQRRMVAGGWLQRRRAPQRSRPQRVLDGVGRAMPHGRRGKAGGMAALAAAAAVAFKSRDKVRSMLRRDDAKPA